MATSRKVSDLVEGDVFNNSNNISADKTTTMLSTRNYMLIGDITVSASATWTVGGTGELKII
jgi:hypothetical protein